MTSRELAKLAGVSQSTVSLCLNNSSQVSAKTKERVSELAARYKFELNSQARNLKMQKSDAVGMIFPRHFEDLSTDVYTNQLYNRIRKQLAPHGIELIAAYENDSANPEEYLLSLLRRKRVDGFISMRPLTDTEVGDYIRDNGIPCVYLLNDESQYTGSPSVISGNAAGARLVAELFALRGYRRVMTLGTGISSSASPARSRGFRDGCRDWGIPFDDSRLLLAGSFQFQEGKRAALENAGRLRECDAVYVQGDVMALGFMEGLRECGIRVPEDLRVVGHDDNPMSTWFRPTLTTVSNMGPKVSEATGVMMLQCLSGEQPEPAKVLYVQELILRESC